LRAESPVAISAYKNIAAVFWYSKLRAENNYKIKKIPEFSQKSPKTLKSGIFGNICIQRPAGL
jgi:hypothetical protein